MSESSRVRLSPNLRPVPPSRVGGSLIRATQQSEQVQERMDQLTNWQRILVPGECTISVNRDTHTAFAISGDGSEVDVTELLEPGSQIVRHRPDGDITWKVRGIAAPLRENLPSRLSLENDGKRTSIPFTQLMREPDENNRNWVIPVPVE